MGSGRGDRNQRTTAVTCARPAALQWGPVVVTGIRIVTGSATVYLFLLQWGPVVVTGISGCGDASFRLYTELQWGPVVVTGISGTALPDATIAGYKLQWGPVVVTGIRARG